eukprot:CAMPEP_0118957570 /NCGR_PEP_ID=MMETSP1169-20130426/62173_1 /TAXON_ID=36882 /ORGANISM="Pyramimonas obovata, Strain CCMP722" /LENGTH=485 /DNA_ID=CAMNT_0006905657 /DNA_START=271 /DNA_END=1728 /DNA_ORIENTATION=+
MLNEVSTLAGYGGDGEKQEDGGYVDGEGVNARFLYPDGLTVDRDGNIIVCDYGASCIRKVTPQGVVTTLVGEPGDDDYEDGDRVNARLSRPEGVAMDNTGNVIVADSYNHCIRKVTPQGVVTTLAGDGNKEGAYKDGRGVDACFHYPSTVAVDGDGNFIVSDRDNHCIRKVTPQGVVTTLAGAGGQEGYKDGVGVYALFHNPVGVAVDGDGNVIVADRMNHCIRKVTPQGEVSTLAGVVQLDGYGNPKGGYANGEGRNARFRGPEGLAIDWDGNVIVCDGVNRCIRKVAAHLTPPRTSRPSPPAHESSLTTDFQKGLESADFHDVTFVVDNERLPAHRFVLASRCEYFRSMFSEGFQERGSTEIKISEGISAAAFKALLNYLYTDCMDVEDGLLVEMVKVCDQYHVVRLRDHCMRRLNENITEHNAISWLVQAHTLEGAKMVKQSLLTGVALKWRKIVCHANSTLRLLDEHPSLYKEILERWGHM